MSVLSHLVFSERGDVMLRVALLLSAVGLLAAGPVGSEGSDRFWILWEKQEMVGENCPHGQRCTLKRNYASRLVDGINLQKMYRLFGMMDGAALSTGRLAEHPQAPRICQHNDPEVLLGFDPERLPMVEKVEVLRGLAGVNFDLRNLAAPPGHSSDFGRKLHNQFVAKLKDAGIKILTKEEVSKTPGQPVLNIYFSHNEFNGACEYEYTVFASLSQTVLLTRDLRVKVTAGVWSYSMGSTSDKHKGSETDIILGVADSFITDYRLVNGN